MSKHNSASYRIPAYVWSILSFLFLFRDWGSENNLGIRIQTPKKLQCRWRGQKCFRPLGSQCSGSEWSHTENAARKDQSVPGTSPETPQRGYPTTPAVQVLGFFIYIRDRSWQQYLEPSHPYLLPCYPTCREKGVCKPPRYRGKWQYLAHLNRVI